MRGPGAPVPNGSWLFSVSVVSRDHVSVVLELVVGVLLPAVPARTRPCGQHGTTEIVRHDARLHSPRRKLVAVASRLLPSTALVLLVATGSGQPAHDTVRASPCALPFALRPADLIEPSKLALCGP